MPFIQRVVEPVFLSRRNAGSEEENKVLTDYELETVANCTLSNALRQLASLVLIANDIFDSLTKELEDVRDRSSKLRSRIEAVEEKVSEFDPKTVTVPESDVCSFAARTHHFAASHAPTVSLFSAATRPSAVRQLYAAAAPTPLPVMRQLDRYRRDGARCSRYFSCTPVLGGGRRRARPRRQDGSSTDIEDIETSMPASVSVLRRWTSEEALGDITVAPDCSRVPAAASLALALTAATAGGDGEGPAAGASAAGAGDETDGAEHRLPSPEEQAAAVAAHFPGEVVAVDVSGRPFRRMSLVRRSMLETGGKSAAAAGGSSSAGTGRKRARSRRRNTIAGTDRREIRRALAGESQEDTDGIERPPSLAAVDDSIVGSSRNDSQKNKDSSSSSESKKSHFNSLKQWGKGKLKLIKGSNSSGSGSRLVIEASEESNIYETVTLKGKMADLKNEKKACSAGSNLPISTQSGAMNLAVKLRQRQARTGKDDALHSSSGNWSASSESGRASIGSETTHQPKSTTTLSSAATSSNSLNHHPPSSSVSSRRKFLNTSTSSSVSEGTLTPDIVSDFAVPFADDGETSSIYSCDTEGYYTSFHLDSGLKTLKEEEPLSTPQTPLHSTSALSNSPGRGNTLTAENEYELFGKGSTSTTTSSAGTVCTTLLVSNNESCLSLARGPTVPERKSSLDQKQNDAESTSQMVIAMVHKQRGCETSESPDSGHNTSSSPVDSTSSPHGTLTGRSSEYEFSESDLEGVDRLERIRVKTTINSSRIPSMCVITPPPSDDETSLNQYVPLNRRKYSVPSDSQKRKSLLETDFGPDVICTQEKIISDVICNKSEKPQVCSIDQNSKENHSSSVQTENKEVPRTLISSSARPLKVTPNYIYAEPNKKESRNPSQVQQDKTNHTKSSLIPPFNNVLGKMKEVLSCTTHRKVHETGSLPLIRGEKATVDAGDYVTISKSNEPPPPTLQQGTSKESRDADILSNSEMEYVSLNELPVAKSPTANILISPSNSLERKRRQGARVTLDSQGKVVYSSDSLRRNKGSHSTFEPGPYVKDTVSTPTASPLMVHRSTKLNIRPVTMTSHGINSVSTKPLSPVPDNKQSRTVSPLSPKLGKVIIRASSKTNSQVTSPASPVPCETSDHPVSPQPARGAYVKMKSPDELQQQTLNRGETTIPVDSPNEEEGHTMLQTCSSQYKDPPSARLEKKTYAYSGNQDSSNKHWNLPFRFFSGTSREKSCPNSQGKYFHPSPTINGYNEYDFNSNANDMKVASKPGSILTSQVTSTFSNSAKQNLFKMGEEYCPQRTVRLPTPASIPLVPKTQSPQYSVKEMHQQSVLSSTPTKTDKINSFMEMSTVLSPIQKTQIDFNCKTNGSIPQKELQSCKSGCTSPNTINNPVPVQPKSSMTAEELFAAIHKSKKRMNIKGDFDNYCRSGSPSSVSSISPGNSESSINGLKGIHCNENVRLGIENVSQNRHSWSPNVKQTLDFQTTPYQHVSFLTNSYKQSRASDRLGPPQQTSRHDFKRLLLQHGSKTNGAGTYRGKLSAVEQLRLSRQQKQNIQSSSNSPNGAYMPLSPSDKRYSGPKLLPSPRSASSWRFASPRTDILSSTIPEDCAEEERALSSQEENIDQPLDLTSSSHCSQDHVLNSTINNVCRINGLPSPTETFPQRQETLKSFSSPMYHKSNQIQNHLSLTKHFEENPLVQNSNCTSVNMNKRHSISAPLSPSNIKENVDTNQQCSSHSVSSSFKSISGSLPQSQLANLRARQMFMNQSIPLSKESYSPPIPPYKSPLASESQKQTSFNSRGSPARSILAEIERKSPARATLETAL